MRQCERRYYTLRESCHDVETVEGVAKVDVSLNVSLVVVVLVICLSSTSVISSKSSLE